MSDLLDTLLAKSGKTRDSILKDQSRVSKIQRKKGVTDGPDIQRALDLPRRVWQDTHDLSGLIDQMTDWLKAPGGQHRLFPIQTVTLLELHDYKGAFAPIRVGGGKTLISLLAARVLNARKPLLVVPAGLRDKTKDEIGDYRKNWNIKVPILQSYEMLSRENKARYLHEIGPDLLMFDEGHKLKNLDAAVTKRVVRYMREHPETIVLYMTGTPTDVSIMEYAHILRWTHRDECQPLPLDHNRLSVWSYALDQNIPPNSRVRPGALMRFAEPEDGDGIRGARKGYQRRLVETPGVIVSKDPPLPFGLEVREIGFEPPPLMVEHFETLREDWMTPDGHPCADAVAIWRHARELACGFFYVWDPRPPRTLHPITTRTQEDAEITWLDSRKEWAAYCRYVLRNNRSDLDSEKQVRSAVINGTIGPMRGYETVFDPLELWEAWSRIKPTFKPNTKAVWFDETMIDIAAEWLGSNNGICWVEHKAFGRHLARMTGLPYFGRQGLDRKGNYIMNAKGPIIAGIASNSTGRNLQHYRHNLVVSMPSRGASWEQLLGRTHREPRPFNKTQPVTFDLVLPCLEQFEAFQKAIAGSQFVSDTTGQIQKLSYADTDVSLMRDVYKRLGPLWNKSV